MRIGDGSIYIPQYMIIIFIMGENGIMYAANIMRKTNATYSTVTKILHRLVNNAWSTKVDKGRCSYYELTSRGQNMYHSIKYLLEQMEIDLLKELDTERKELEGEQYGENNKRV